MRMAENLFTGLATLTPSYKQIEQTQQTSTQPKIENQKLKNLSFKNGQSNVYVPDMSEPKTYLSRVLPHLLQFDVPTEVKTLFSENFKSNKLDVTKITDVAFMEAFGFKVKAAPNSKYSVLLIDNVVTLEYFDSNKAKVHVSGGGISLLLSTIATAILIELTEQLRTKEVWVSSNFNALSRKMIYNPYYKIASIIPLGGINIPPIVSMILMDNRLSLVSLSYMLRSTSINATLLNKYRSVSEQQEEMFAALVTHVSSTPKGNIVYNFLCGNGVFTRVTIHISGVVKVANGPRAVKYDDSVMDSVLSTDWVDY